MDNSSWDSELGLLSGQANSSVISPEYDLNMPFASYKFESLFSDNLTTCISIDRGNWTEIEPSMQKHIYRPCFCNQVKYEGYDGNWSLDNIKLQLYVQINFFSRMDVDNDGVYEWDVVGDGIGSWGNQDVLLNNNMTTNFTVGLNPTTWPTYWSQETQSRLN